jgi:hypothetical protein
MSNAISLPRIITNVFFFFDMSIQEEGEGFELMTSTL